MELPPNLEELALFKFDRLLQWGKLFYSPSEPEELNDHGFSVRLDKQFKAQQADFRQFEFRICPALRTKPSLAGLDPVRSKASSPFVNPDPEFYVAYVGPLHTLILSKYCVYRPSYILHTNEYLPQKDNLNDADIAATWILLSRLNVPQLVLFNCGAEAGASQGHKHIQLMPRPTQPCLELFPDKAELSSTTPTSIPGVPYKHFVLGIPMDATASDVAKRYNLLLDTMRNSVRPVSSIAYNMLMVRDWIMIIPRRHAACQKIRANGAGMMGFVWVQDAQERDGWLNLGMAKVLTHMGFPLD